MSFGSPRPCRSHVTFDLVPPFISLFALLALAPHVARAQAAPGSAPSAEAAASAGAPSERARRDAELVFDMIRMQADRPRKSAVAGKDDKNGVMVRVRATPRVAAPPADAGATLAAQAVVQRVSNATPPTVALAPAAVPATATPPATALAAAPTALAPHNEPDAPDTMANLRPTAAGRTIDPEPLPAPVSAPLSAEPESKLIALASPTPNFPRQWLQSLRKGVVQVRFQVQPDGSVAQVEVVASSSPHLNQAALDAVAQWRFEPIGKPQPGLVDLSFDLDAD